MGSVTKVITAVSALMAALESKPTSELTVRPAEHLLLGPNSSE